MWVFTHIFKDILCILQHDEQKCCRCAKNIETTCHWNIYFSGFKHLIYSSLCDLNFWLYFLKYLKVAILVYCCTFFYLKPVSIKWSQVNDIKLTFWQQSWQAAKGSRYRLHMIQLCTPHSVAAINQAAVKSKAENIPALHQTVYPRAIQPADWPSVCQCCCVFRWLTKTFSADWAGRADTAERCQ